MTELKRPDKIQGYEHPTFTNYSDNNGIYKTFTDNKKQKEEFGITIVGKQYAVYGNYDEELCPICNEPPINICQCGYNDKKCSKSHMWYTDRDGKIKNGNPHISKNYYQCNKII